jgi:hypothetical protein
MGVAVPLRAFGDAMDHAVILQIVTSNGAISRKRPRMVSSLI